jgi:AhpD family alkylhydroperoxidase
MPSRLDFSKISPGGYMAMRHLEAHIRQSGLEPGLLELVKTRASQLNGCAYCIDMHTKDARAHGESEQRLYALPAWRETPFFSARERAALAWTEAVTLVAEGPIEEEDYEDVREQFDERSLADLTLAIVAINGWNRLAIAFAAVPGTYQSSASNRST